ncbi:MAG TPA: hypothetical protein VF509_14820 [Sphingobium sp.]
MSTINCQSGYQAQMSPRAMMDRRIESAVSAGSISKVDQTAMESALDSIDAALSSSGSTEIAGKLDPKDMKGRIDSLIEDQVSGGTLTAEQASQLQALFGQGPSSPSAPDSVESDGMTMGGVRGLGGPDGPPPPPKSDKDDTDSDGSMITGAQASAMDRLNSLIAFLENLRNGIGSDTYGSAGASGGSSDNSGLVVDATA